MKKILLSIALVLAVYSVNSQKVTKTPEGNYVAVKDTAASYQPTGKTYTDSKDIVYPVYVSKSGKLFIFRTSKKTGKQYRQYLKED